MNREETLKDRIATIVQRGHTSRLTSDEIATEISFLVTLTFIELTQPKT